MTLKRIVAGLALVVASLAASAGAYEDFFIAIANDNAGAVEALLKRGLDPNTVDPKGQPGLVLAVKEQSRRATQALLAQPGTDVNLLNPAGESALMMAALKGDLVASRLLLDRGARVNQPGWAPLHYAATGPEPQVVELLLQKGATIDAESPNATTPLMMAAQYGSEDSVKVLLQRGADLNRRNQKGLSAADFARLASRESLAARLDNLRR